MNRRQFFQNSSLLAAAANAPAAAPANVVPAAPQEIYKLLGFATMSGEDPLKLWARLRPTSEWLLPPLSASSFPSGEQDRGGGGEEEKKNKSSTGTATAAVLAAEENTKVSELVSVLDDPAASAERGAYWESLLDAAGLGGLRGG